MILKVHWLLIRQMSSVHPQRLFWVSVCLVRSYDSAKRAEQQGQQQMHMVLLQWYVHNSELLSAVGGSKIAIKKKTKMTVAFNDLEARKKWHNWTCSVRTSPENNTLNEHLD